MYFLLQSINVVQLESLGYGITEEESTNVHFLEDIMALNEQLLEPREDELESINRKVKGNSTIILGCCACMYST